MTFPYPPLPDEDALRLLKLKAGRFFDPLEGDLVSVAFLAKPKYLTLSYTWDDPTQERPDLPAAFIKPVDVPDNDSGYLESITCQREATLALNGHEVPITHNLALALRYLRSATHPLTLWVDAVCINQTNIDERNSQVALMAMIYSRAVAVVTWLGLNGLEIINRHFRLGLVLPDTPLHLNENQMFLGALHKFQVKGGIEAAMAMRKVYKLGNSKELAPWFAEHTASHSSVSGLNLTESHAAEKEALERIAAINRLDDTMAMATSYWQRVWVVQEVCLARKVFFVYGPTLFVDQQAVWSAHQMKGFKVTRGMSNMLGRRKQRFSSAMRLETLIEDFAGQMCTEPRDKIYGLVGLANDVNAVQSRGNNEVTIQDGGSKDVDFIIDYRRSFYDIWCDAVQYLFRCPHYFVPDTPDASESQLAILRQERLVNVVRFAGLVQNTLQGEVERELAASSFASEEDSQLRSPLIFGHHLVPALGYQACKIVDLGTSYADFVGSFRHQTAWRTKWRAHYRKEHELRRLREIEEGYAAKIIEYSEADVARVARIEGERFVAFGPSDNGPLYDLTNMQTEVDGVQTIDDMLKSLSIKQGVPEDTPGGKVCRFLGTDQCMGLAPPGAAVGDWVVRFVACDAAVVVRPDQASDPKSPCALVGRADVADLLNRNGSRFDNGSTAIGLYGSNNDNKRVNMVMPWHTLQRITASIAT